MSNNIEHDTVFRNSCSLARFLDSRAQRRPQPRRRYEIRRLITGVLVALALAFGASVLGQTLARNFKGDVR